MISFFYMSGRNQYESSSMSVGRHLCQQVSIYLECHSNFHCMYCTDFYTQSVGSYTDQKNKLQHMTEAGEIYMFKDHTTDEQMDELLSGTEQQKKIQKLYQYARKALEKAGDGNEWIADSSEAFMLTDELQIKYKDVIPFDSDQGVAEVKRVAVSPNFFQVYNIKYEGALKAWRKRTAAGCGGR